MSGFCYFGQISGIDFQNPKFQIPEKPDPKFSGYPNAQPYIEWLMVEKGKMSLPPLWMEIQ